MHGFIEKSGLIFVLADAILFKNLIFSSKGSSFNVLSTIPVIFNDMAVHARLFGYETFGACFNVPGVFLFFGKIFEEET